VSSSQPNPPRDTDALDAALVGVRGAIARERGPLAWVRARSTRTRVVLALAAAALIAILPVAVGHPERVHDRWSARVAMVAVAYVVLLVAAARSALRGMDRAESRASDVALALGAIAAPFVLAAAPPDGAFAPIEGYGQCFFIGSAMGWLLFFAMRALERKGVGRVPALLAIGAGGIAANLALHVGCAYTSAGHRIVCHATIGLACVAQWLFVRALVTVSRRRA
jgi:hypothetical protein